MLLGTSPIFNGLLGSQSNANLCPRAAAGNNRECQFMRPCAKGRKASLVLAAAILGAIGTSLVATPARAQFGISQQVGGVWVDADGVLRNRQVDETDKVRAAREAMLHPVPADARALGLRKISLRRLEAAIADHLKTGEPLDDEMKYLAGLQHIQYVFVYPELGDIVLAGPGEGWKINADGDLVGLTTGRPVMWLDDLLVALRTAEATQQTGISCSINPTNEGIVRVSRLFAKMHREGFGTNPPTWRRGCERSSRRWGRRWFRSKAFRPTVISPG